MIETPEQFMRIEAGEGVDCLVVYGQRLPFHAGLYRARSCDAETFRLAVTAAHQAAWMRGENGFVYTEDTARADGVIQ